MRGRPRKRRASVLNIGFRVLAPDGQIKAEAWHDPQTDQWSVTNFDFSGHATDAGLVTSAELLAHVYREAVQTTRKEREDGE